MLNLSENLNNNLKNKILKWYESIENIDRKELEDFVNKSSNKELEEAFLYDLEFGTGGIRGIMGIGSFRMNKYTVGKATQGIANYFIKTGVKEKKACISYDTRNNSYLFAKITSAILASNGFKVYIMKNPAPTPCLSYAVRKYETTIGVMITASHNPKEYNGYKLYDNTGCQITSPIDKEIIKEVNSIDDLKTIKFGDFESLVKDSKIEFIDEEYFYNSYIDEIIKNIDISILKKNLNNFKIVYTSLHGTGIAPIKRIVERLGINNLYYVDEQITPDGNFSTVKLPNPEDKEAFYLGIEKAKKISAEIVLASDPDADRVGVVFLQKDEKGDVYKFFPDGNEIATMIFYYLLKNRDYKNNPYAINTIVTTDLHELIAKDFNVEFYRVLTGFKYIGEIINKNKGRDFVFGGEESYGYLVGDHARDKDAIIIILLLIELFSYLKQEGIKVEDFIDNIYKKYGYYKNTVYSLNLEGLEGMEKMKNIMENLRTKKCNLLPDLNIVKYIDYKNDNTGLPKSDVLQFFGENFKITVRPSGTEPKIKIYFQTSAKTKEEAFYLNEKLKERIFEVLK
ncbi:MAG: phospho-sugar mutase [Spirochaetes bacterium]|nr:phospho-sugar mutase [Spirochaetota bacterium]